MRILFGSWPGYGHLLPMVPSRALPRRRRPDQVGFATTPELARRLLQRALEAGVPAGWVTAEEVDGNSPARRGWLEAASGPTCWRHVHRAAAGAVGSYSARGPAGRPHPAGGLAVRQRRPGCQGPPLVRLDPGGAGQRRRAGWWGRWLLVRRSLPTGELAY